MIDNLVRADLGGDIHNDNPAEELNRCVPLSSASACVLCGYCIITGRKCIVVLGCGRDPGYSC